MSSRTECPLCGETAGDTTGMYSHLLTDHRKSTISRELIETWESTAE